MVKLLVKRGEVLREYHDISVDEYTTVLEALLWVRETKDPTLALRYSCRMGLCGSCGMEINGKPRLACQTRVEGLGEVVKLEPLRGYKVIRDLVPDLSYFFSRYSSVKPYLLPQDEAEQEKPTSPYIQFPENIEQYLQFNYCIQCGICVSACPVTREDPQFIGPAALNVAYRYSADSRDAALRRRVEVIDQKHGLWDCRIETLCSAYCPKGVDPSLAIQKMKAATLKSARNKPGDVSEV